MIVNIEKLDYEGRGIAHINGKVIFIPKVLPEEVVEIKIVLEKKKYAMGKVLRILKKSPKRIGSFCPCSKQCGGCTFDITTYQDSLEFKKEIAKDILRQNKIEVGDFSILCSRGVLEYRNKITLHVKDSQIGYYVEESHEFVPIKTCYLGSNFIQNIIKDFDLFSFSSGEFTIRSNSKGEVLLHIKTKEKVKIKESLVLTHQIKGILINGKCVYGTSFLEETRDKYHYKIHANAFFQVNPYISEKIVEDILPFIKPYDTVYDLYCGVGFFSIRISDFVKKVIGIELNLNAIINAKENAFLNHKENISFHVGKVEDILKKMKDTIECVLVDPPRSGLNKSIIDLFLKESPQRIIYISCNIKTLVRDLNDLLQSYKITFFRLYDMFSYTKHFECVCVLNKR